jgi:hypothetical protein
VARKARGEVGRLAVRDRGGGSGTVGQGGESRERVRVGWVGSGG